MNLNSILGIKIEQTATFDEKGKRIPVTKVMAGPCVICHIRRDQVNNYQSVQLGFGTDKKANKAILGHIRGAGLKTAPHFFREFKVLSEEALEKGKEIKVGDVFQAGDVVKVSGTSKGKGFAGVVKRHGFHGGPKTHGQSDRHRSPGSIGSTTTPGRVYKGKKMAGRMGGKTVTVKNLQIVAVDNDHNVLMIKGLVPGSTGGLLTITKE